MPTSTPNENSDSDIDAPPDSHISHATSLSYWNSVSPDVSGMLGGYPQVSRIDLQGSRNFVTKLRRLAVRNSNKGGGGAASAAADGSSSLPPLHHVVDCGAGIGRITANFLSTIALHVDIVEPVSKFASVAATCAPGHIADVFITGLEAWTPPAGRRYDLIWNQWCLGHLTDDQLRVYLERCASALADGGWIVVKENLSSHAFGEDLYDDLDSSVTRSDGKFRQLFDDAGLVIVRAELQTGFPKGLGLYPVKMYALRPK